ncbi:adhesion G-protein coupled receptor G6-like [Cloeon dipterum]|uniref:adhesion G-protein coupled receptor G6-like n=1 Tax=Cloeon dipterum TaxID=197152 RepID=UPI00321F9792
MASLNVTIENYYATSTDFNFANLHCFSNSTDGETLSRVLYEERSRPKYGTILYDLIIPKDGVVKCEYIYFGKVSAESNELYVRSGNKQDVSALEELKKFSEKLTNSRNPLKLKDIANKFEEVVTADMGLLDEVKAQNLSNELLVNLDSALVANIELVNKSIEETRENFAARIENLDQTGSVGLVIFDDGETHEDKNRTTQRLVPIMKWSDNSIVMDPNVSSGMRLPERLLTSENVSKRLMTSVFQNSTALFNKNVSTSTVVNVNLGGEHHNNLDEPIIIWFRRNVSIPFEACAFWDFSLKNGSGDWATKGCSLNNTHRLPNSTYVMDECHCSHLTHFAEIVRNSERYLNSESLSEIEVELEQISIVGCIISLVALSFTFIAVAISPKWLAGVSQKIMLQMAMSFAMLLILFLVAKFVSEQELGKTGRFFIGFFLHYAILSNFFWMLVAGYLQYNRLVKVIYCRTPNLLLKVSTIGWGVPVIPGAITLLSMNFWVYSKPPLYLPYGVTFYLTILTPLVIILALNLSIFAAILRNIYLMSKDGPRKHCCVSTTRVKQIVFLFVLLGLGWILAVCQEVFEYGRDIFAYLFCLTVSFQGVFFFIFIVPVREHMPRPWRLH